MSPRIHSLVRRASAPLIVLFLIVSAVHCFADTYSDEGTVYITGNITEIQNQEACERYGCQIGSSWNLAITFLAPNWNAPGSSYFISTVLLNCFGGPPCITGYQAGSDFGWGPYGFDTLSVDIEDGKVVDARASSGGYFIEWGQADLWNYVDDMSGTTTGYAIPTPDAATILAFATGVVLARMRLNILRLAG